jgi:hypothetical protein
MKKRRKPTEYDYLWGAYTLWKYREGSQQTDSERAFIEMLDLNRPWEEQADEVDMPYRPPHRPLITEWDMPETEHLLDHWNGEHPPHIEDDDETVAHARAGNHADTLRHAKEASHAKEVAKADAKARALEASKAMLAELAAQALNEQENPMVRMTRERMAVLTALEDAGGSIYDPTGGATNKLAALCGREEGIRSFTGTLARMTEEGLIVREVNGRRTLRIALPDAGGDNFAELIDSLKVLGGAVEENGESADTLLRGVMQFTGSKRAFRDLLDRASKQNVVEIDWRGKRAINIRLVPEPTVVKPAPRSKPVKKQTTDVTQEILSSEVDLAQEPVEPLTATPEPEPRDFSTMTGDELQAVALYLLDEVVARATAPSVSEVTPAHIEAMQRVTVLESDLEMASRILTDRLNQLDEAERRVKELENENKALTNDVNAEKIKATKVEQELNRRPVGPKVSEIISDDSKTRLENFKKLMQARPTTKG